MAKIDLAGYYHTDKGLTLKRLPQEPSRLETAFHAEASGGIDEFRQVGWISMNTNQVWGLDDKAPKNVPDMTPLFIRMAPGE